MNGLFLANLATSLATSLSENDTLGAILGLILAAMIFFLIFGVLVYVYISFAYMAIGRKAGLSVPGLAWIPSVGPLVIAFQASKMHWWPWLLLLSSPVSLIASIFSIALLIPFIPTIFGILGFIGTIVFAVYVIIWHWKMFESIGKPGWWTILCFIPIVNFVIIGIAAWSKKQEVDKNTSQASGLQNYQ